MGRYVTMQVEAEIDMREFEDHELMDEINRRDKLKKEVITARLGLDLPVNNLDFRMKLELFLEVWQDIPFTELKDRLNAHNKR